LTVPLEDFTCHLLRYSLIVTYFTFREAVGVHHTKIARTAPVPITAVAALGPVLDNVRTIITQLVGETLRAVFRMAFNP